MNRVVLVGRITKDPELKTIPNGSVVNFSLAVNRPYLSKSGEREADFVNCVTFNKQAENLSRYIRKGGLLAVEGRLQTRTYTANDGSTRYVTEVVCDSIQFLESKSSNYSSENKNSNNENYQNNNSYQAGNSFQARNQNSYEDLQYEKYSPEDDQKADKTNRTESVESQYGITDDDLPF